MSSIRRKFWFRFVAGGALMVMASSGPVYAAPVSGVSASFNSNIQNLDSNGWKLWLDRDASWQSDELFLPPINLSKLPVNPPTGGWGRLAGSAIASKDARKTLEDPSLSLDVQVPGNVEQYYWDLLSGNNKGAWTSGDYKGVSWWSRNFAVPSAAKGKRVKLFFSEGARLRAEVYVNQKLVGYNLMEQLPFEVDVTDSIKPGAQNQLAVRITDPEGNFHWSDYDPMPWGKYHIPMSHGFGGILGAVQLKVLDPVHVNDIYVKNKPKPTDIELAIEFANEGAKAVKGTLNVEIVEAWRNGAPVAKPQSVFKRRVGDFQLAAGATRQSNISVSVPKAHLWEIRNSNLYYAITTIRDESGKIIDQKRQRFGFRWLGIEGVGKDVNIRLNGKRTFLLSAISWGFWPENGIYPTPEMARKHIDAAMGLGQNMLHFHRCVGNTQVLNLADEKGILYYEEPGGHTSAFIQAIRNNDKTYEHFDFPVALSREKLLRMVKRDRSHPSLVVYNMANEPWASPIESSKKMMAEAHLLDPSRIITYASGFMTPREDQETKLHMLPNDQTQRTLGYTDVHNAGESPGVYIDEMYKSPTHFARNERDENELFVWGEEGAIASPPQLELIHNEAVKTGRLRGWDGSDYEDWYQAYARYFKSKGLEKYYPSITKLITSLGDIQYYEHGRLLENVRIADGADINVLNGFEDMKLDNFSGAVDVYRNYKGDPTLISQYMKPLLVAVKARDKIGEVGDTNLLDLFVINEHAIKAGNYRIVATVTTPDGKTTPLWSGTTKVSGGDKFSDLAKEAIPVSLTQKGTTKINAQLLDAAGKTITTGHEEIFVVDWKSDQIGGKGAIAYGSTDLFRFLTQEKKADAVRYTDDLPPLDYVVLGSFGNGDSFQTIPSYNFRAKDGTSEGLNVDYFRGAQSFATPISNRVLKSGINFNDKNELIPGYDILGSTNYTLRFEGSLVPEHSGKTEFEVTIDDGVRVWLDNELVVDDWNFGAKRTQNFTRDLVAGKKYTVKVEYFQGGGDAILSLKWKLPQVEQPLDLKRLLQRVQNDGTRLIVMGDADKWAEELKKQGAFPDYKFFKHSGSWVGGNYMVREHPFFEGLPVNGAMNWQYQRLVTYNGPNYGFYDMQGEEPVVSSVGGASHLVATSVGILPYGKGKIVFSSLDLIPNLMSDKKASDVPRKIFCNMLKWAAVKN